MAKNKILVRIENLLDKFDFTHKESKPSRSLNIMKFATDFYKNANQKELPCTVTIQEVSPSAVPLRNKHTWKAKTQESESQVNTAQTDTSASDDKDLRVFGPQAIRTFLISYQQSPTAKEKMQSIA